MDLYMSLCILNPETSGNERALQVNERIGINATDALTGEKVNASPIFLKANDRRWIRMGK